MTTVFEVLHKRAEPYKVTLTRGQKETYGWEITVNATGPGEALGMLTEADTMLRQKFGGGEQHGEQ